MRQQLGLQGVVADFGDDDLETHSDAYYTPQEWVDRVERFFANDGGLDLDPAWHPHSLVRPRIGYTREQDGLVSPWPEGANGFCNPPFSDPDPFLRLIVEHQINAGGCWIVLLKCDPSTAWWKRYLWGAADRITFLYKRVAFHHQGEALGAAKFPCATALFAHPERGRDRTSQLTRYARIFGEPHGKVWRPE